MVNKRVQNAVLGCNLRNKRMISVHLQGKPYNITVIQVCALISNAEEAEVEWFYEDLQDLLELTPKKDVLFLIGDWYAKVGSQETPGVTGKFGLGVQNKAGQRLIEFCQENALVIANTLFQQHKRRLYIWTSTDGQHWNQIDYIFFSQKWRSSFGLLVIRTQIQLKLSRKGNLFTHITGMAKIQASSTVGSMPIIKIQCLSILSLSPFLFLTFPHSLMALKSPITP